MSRKSKRFWRVPTIGVHEQLAAMRLAWPRFRCEVRAGLLVCAGEVQPRPVTDRYTARIEYRVGWRPRTFIVRPALRRRHPEGRIAHTYSDTELCLFTWAAGDWSPDQFIARTIVPWLHEWIVFYEAWLLTGEWQGGGTMPGPAESGEGKQSA